MTDAKNKHPLAVELEAVVAGWRVAAARARRAEREAKLRADEYEERVIELTGRRVPAARARRAEREAKLRAEEYEERVIELEVLLERCATNQVVTCGACGRFSPPPDEHVCARCDDEQSRPVRECETGVETDAADAAAPHVLLVGTLAQRLAHAYEALRWCAGRHAASRRLGEGVAAPPGVKEAFRQAQMAQESNDD